MIILELLLKALWYFFFIFELELVFLDKLEYLGELGDIWSLYYYWECVS